MAQIFEQSQSAQQNQVQTAFQVAVAKLVELPVTELAVRVQDELAENAALEEADRSEDFGNETDACREDADGQDEERNDERDDTNSYEETENYGSEADAMGDYFSADDVPDYLQQRAEAQRDRDENFYAAGHDTSFYDELQSQIAEHNLSEHEQSVMEYLIGSLDADGFMRKDLDSLSDELAIYHNILSSREELEQLLTLLQHFEPKGLGARSLQECLHIQLADMEPRTPYVRIALDIVDRYFKEFADHRWDFIKQRLHIDDETFDHVRYVLTHLNPLPGNALSDQSSLGAPALVPDVYITVNEDDAIEVGLNKGEVPELRISRAFMDTLKAYGNSRQGLTRAQKDAYTYARQKVDSAQTFIQMLQRRRSTILSVVNIIVEVQRDFFLNEDEETLLRPLTAKEVARRTGLSESVVSRVSNTKYAQTAHSIYPLKYFFSRSFSNSEEGEDLTSRRIRIALQEIIDKEDPTAPCSDEQLAALLTEAGFQVARRTVAKYRDIMGLPTARLRKEMYKNGEKSGRK